MSDYLNHINNAPQFTDPRDYPKMQTEQLAGPTLSQRVKYLEEMAGSYHKQVVELRERVDALTLAIGTPE